jgi:general secretion pathway protein G
MKRGLSLVELMIVVAILGILGAVVFSRFQSDASEAETAAAKSNLSTLRAPIEFYAHHNWVGPGYPMGDPAQNPPSVYLN